MEGDTQVVSSEVAAPASTGESAENNETGTTSWFGQDAPESETGKEEVAAETPAVAEDAKSDSTNDETGEDDAEVDSTEKKPAKGFEKRIERFNRRLAEKDQVIETLLKKMSGNTESTPVVQQVAMPQNEPKFADFKGDIDAFTRAHTTWGVQNALRQHEATRQKEAVVKSYTQREAEFKKATPDYADVMQELQEDYKNDKRAGYEFNAALVESDVGPQMYHYLGTHRDEIERILNLPTHKQLVELGKLEAKLSGSNGAPATKSPPKVSKAPAPTTSEKGSPPVVVKLSDPNLPQKDYRLARMANRKRM